MYDYAVIEKPSMTVVGIECRTSNAPEAGPYDIPKHWEKFFLENVMDLIPNKVSGEVIALYCDYEGDHTLPYSLVIGCEVRLPCAIPEKMVAKTVPAGTYAQFRAIGEHPQSLIETWGKIWETELDRTFTGDYELYGERFSSALDKEVEVYIAITAR